MGRGDSLSPEAAVKGGAQTQGSGLTPAQLQLLLQGRVSGQEPPLHVWGEAELLQDGGQLFLLPPRGHGRVQARDVGAPGHRAIQAAAHHHVGHCGG